MTPAQIHEQRKKNFKNAAHLMRSICAKLLLRYPISNLRALQLRILSAFDTKWRHAATTHGLPTIRVRTAQTNDEATTELTKYLLSPVDAAPNDDGYSITRLMYYIWQSRTDLNRIFDLQDKISRLEFCRWFLLWGMREYELPADAYPDDVLNRLAKSRGIARRIARSMLVERQKGSVKTTSHDTTVNDLQLQRCTGGINLLGQFRGEFGLGELSRAAVRACRAAAIPYSIVDCPITDAHGSKDNSIEDWTGDTTQDYRFNLLTFTPVSLPSSYFKIGQRFFSRHYNIGYWPWELAKCPVEFELAFRMVDEVWTISNFASSSLRTHALVPILTMPPAVSIPAFSRPYFKADFGLAEGTFHFLFAFDAASSLARKNPAGVARAFKSAFPRDRKKVQLVFKVMNASKADPAWEELLATARNDGRIVIIDKRLSREEALGLTSVCDAFVSLHRSEGFGFGLAEAMLLGKPVVTTNYSGTRDFAHEGTACLVDYTLTAVPERCYPFWDGQFWAEPDIEHAAQLMQRLVDDGSHREEIARAGQRFVSSNFNERIIGARYAARLDELRRRLLVAREEL